MNETTTATESESKPEYSATITEPAVKIQQPRRPLRLIVPTLILVAYWIVTEASHQLEMGMFYRFVTRMIALLVTLLFFLGWGLTRRHFGFGQRCLAFGIIVGTMLLAGAIGHPATGMFATAMMGLPFVISLSVLWLWGTRHGGARLELTGIGIASVLVFGVISQLRWDGLDGRQRPELSWRWTPSPEERFLQLEARKPFIPSVDDRPELKETASDWSSFRGGERESVVRGVDLGDWSVASPQEVWRRRVGPGWSSVIAIDDYLFTQEQRGDQEAVVSYEIKSGKEVWVHSPKDSAERFNNSLAGAGPRATPTFHQNRIYAYGAKGQFVCLDAVTGKEYWSHSLFQMTEAKVPQWGSATSPTAVDDMVIVFTGGTHDNSLIAFDCPSGEVRWKAPGGTLSYSSPQVLTIAGQRQIVMHDSAGLHGVRIEDGKVLWTHVCPHTVSFDPMLQPHLLAEDRLLVNWDAGLLCLQVRHVNEAWQLEELWTSTKMKPSFNDFVIHGGHIYGLDDGILCCVDLATQKRHWKRGRYGFGQMLLLPEIDELLVLSEQGEVIRVAADPKEHRELGSFKAIEGKTWGHPILVRGWLIVRNSEELACFDLTRTLVARRSN